MSVVADINFLLDLYFIKAQYDKSLLVVCLLIFCISFGCYLNFFVLYFLFCEYCLRWLCCFSVLVMLFETHCLCLILLFNLFVYNLYVVQCLHFIVALLLTHIYWYLLIGMLNALQVLVQYCGVCLFYSDETFLMASTEHPVSSLPSCRPVRWVI